MVNYHWKCQFFVLGQYSPWIVSNKWECTIIPKQTEIQKKKSQKYYKQPNVGKCQKRRCKTTKSSVKPRAAKLFIFSNFVAIFHLSYVSCIICQVDGSSCGHLSIFAPTWKPLMYGSPLKSFHLKRENSKVKKKHH